MGLSALTPRYSGLLLGGLCACHGGPTTRLDDTGAEDSDQTSCSDAADALISLPSDDAQHQEEVEWWSWSGWLQDEEGSRYGMEQLFILQRVGGGVYLSTTTHAALARLDGDQFDYTVEYEDGLPDEVSDGFDFALGPSQASGGGGMDQLHAQLEGASWTLELVSGAEPLLHHGDGYGAYPAGGDSYYYSRPRMQATGELEVDGVPHTVSGFVWFDHQWGGLTELLSKGRSWAVLQLDDGRELMLMLSDDQETFIGATLREDGCSRELDAESLELRSEGSWTSEITGCTYAQQWEIELGEEVFELRASLGYQEVVGSFDSYWKGLVDVGGSGTGLAWLEQAGDCD